MKVYAVGGAVRDELLGLAVKDRDYVVVGATPEQMVRLGYRPVGRDFPVFLHPQTHEEYALARTERKTARGYRGFQVHAAPDVTLEQDLARRDLTINAIARDAQGALVDPFGGAADLRARVLRHVGPAFAEDPVRVLRVARFAARFPAFRVADETLALMRRMAADGEVDALVPERVWQEFAKGLMEDAPQRMFETLAAAGAMTRVLPEWGSLDAARALAALGVAAERRLELAQRFATLFAAADVATAEAACRRLRCPGECRDLAVLAARHGAAMRESGRLDPAALLDLLAGCDAFRRPDRFAALLVVVDCDAAAAGHERHYAEAQRLVHALNAARGVDAAGVAARDPQNVADAIRAARIAAIASAISQ
ncbi:MAG: multifunctional CCA tRNA nucleotidyl transferase/2'3'-cyclic phosphodiesterase/2'nucleotidase/phosphatase [Burkholderiales bacterium]|nr:multifunctional CCA tRNA nucleotidyl transferase/2'3'-cyclic phosphodiesterase/2'nucleotidase/phosphatase [Burkholderiales bacterium]